VDSIPDRLDDVGLVVPELGEDLMDSDRRGGIGTDPPGDLVRQSVDVAVELLHLRVRVQPVQRRQERREGSEEHQRDDAGPVDVDAGDGLRDDRRDGSRERGEDRREDTDEGVFRGHG
jgi:hypothetical protein